MMLPLFILSQP